MPSHEKLPVWDLKQLYSSEKLLEADLRRVDEQTAAFTRFRKQLDHPTKKMVEDAMREMESIALLGGKAATYSGLAFAENSNDAHAKAREAMVHQRLTDAGNKKLFFSLWWKNLDEKKARALLPQNPEYKKTLLDLRKFKKYFLSEKEEQLSMLRSLTGEHALVTVYQLLVNDFTFAWKEGGKTSIIRDDKLASFRFHPDPAKRKQSYDLLWEKYRANNGVLGEIYQNLVRSTWNESVNLRGYKSPIAIRNLSNELSDETVDKLLDTCAENTAIFQDFFEWKAKKLGHKLSRYHLYAPLPHPTKKWSFEDGYAQVMRTYEDFSPHFKEEAHRVLAHKRLDALPRAGKNGGGFCMGVNPGDTSYVLMNWQHNYESVSTLAHELGHATHNHLAGGHSVYLMHAGVPLSETASTFGEILLTQKLIEDSTNEGWTQYLLANQIEQAYGSIQRQAFFCMFEKEAHELFHAGKTIDDVNAAYYHNLRTQYGKKMELPKNSAFEWGMVHHFFEQAFYVYGYAFGHLLVLAFHDQYMKEGKDFVKRYEKFLSYGGSKDPQKMLEEMGFDPTKKTHWKKGFNVLERKIKQLKALGK